MSLQLYPMLSPGLSKKIVASFEAVAASEAIQLKTRDLFKWLHRVAVFAKIGHDRGEFLTEKVPFLLLPNLLYSPSFVH